MSDPAVEAVRRAKRLGTCGDGPEDFAENAAREALAPLRQLHRPGQDRIGLTVCPACRLIWPCDTAKLIYSSEELR